MEGTVSGSLILAVVVSAIASLVLVAWPLSRVRGRWLVASAALFAVYAAWHVALSLTGASALNVDYSFTLGLSVEDIGSGIGSLLVAFVAMSLRERTASAARSVLGIALVVGLIALVFDRFT